MVKTNKMMLNTAESGSVSAKIKVNGVLQGVSIKADRQINISISFANSPNIVLLNKVGCPIEAFYSLRNFATAPNGEIIPQSCEEWALDDELQIDVSGSKNTKVELIMRFE